MVSLRVPKYKTKQNPKQNKTLPAPPAQPSTAGPHLAAPPPAPRAQHHRPYSSFCDCIVVELGEMVFKLLQIPNFTNSKYCSC